MGVCFLYELKFSSGKSYFGITKNFQERILGHKKATFKKNSHLPVHNAWRKYGEPVSKILACGEEQFIAEMEIAAIAKFNSRIPFGYNVSFGGETSPANTPEFKDRMTGDGNPMKRKEVVEKRFAKGHHMQSPEQRQRARQQQLTNNNMNSPEARAKSSASHTGKKSPRKGVVISWIRPVVCCETGVIFGSVREAAVWCEDAGLSRKTKRESTRVVINAAIRNSSTAYGHKWKLLNER